ncbi:sodium/hydrogen exchanger family protein [Plectosphaerella plurivora]|uniref:Sodium/hydrogen exchanger family protein n=1 Tax=Plectosphaerella plurivora TaxID=936078 RepID=A0A9P9AI12_9PEZI|nr:sodium/hydrogen exchanger family protein [Plectosphaerella plurivora]
MESSLAYHEPSIKIIVILSGFLLLLNIVNHVLDKLIYCGLIGQVLLGIAAGTPGAGWLPREFEEAAMQLGYLGLLLIVYEGGLSTSFKSLKANILLSSGVAATGIAAPMGLSFILSPMVGASPLQAFAAGAALCSTSLGTTFTILGTSGLSSTRLGVVLTSAAMMDDVVGLIMVQVISNLGGDNFTAVTVVRPVVVSIGFAVAAPLVCRFIVQPTTHFLNSTREKSQGGKLDRLLSLTHTAFAVHTIVLLALVVGGTYSGTSGLFAAYIAGAAISWWDSELPHPTGKTATAAPTGETLTSSAPTSRKANEGADTTQDQPQLPEQLPCPASSSGHEVYKAYYGVVVEHFLKPLFFASIGFSIPVTRMFSGPIVWRGVVYAVFMTLAKIGCGIWLISFATPLHSIQKFVGKVSALGKTKSKGLAPGNQCAAAPEPTSQTPAASSSGVLEEPSETPTNTTAITTKNASPDPEMPVSLYPASILAFAMVARGEIGFLISALAEANGIFGRQSGAAAQPSELFLIVTWAISLCTIGGPICVGLLVGRVKKLESNRPTREKRNVLGAWGVS